MQFLSPLTLISTLVLMSPAVADVSPKDVWSDVKGILSTIGTVSDDTENTTDGLTVTKLKIDGEKGGTFVLTDPITLTANVNGTVSFQVPSQMAPRWVTQSGQYLKLFTTHDALVMTATGDPQDIEYLLDAKSFGAGFETRPGNSKDVSNVNLVLTDLRLRTNRLDDNPQGGEARLNAKALQTFVAAAPNTPFSRTASSTFQNPSAFFRYDVPPEVLENGFESTSFDGLRLDLSLSYTHAEQQTVIGKTQAKTSTSGTGRIAFKVLDQTAGFSARTKDLTGPIKIANTILPTPLKLDQLAMSMNMPIGYLDGPSEADLRVNIDGLTLPDLVWGMFDPTQTLPRTPVSLNFDLTGTGNFNRHQDSIPEALRGLIQPSVLQSLKINRLNLKLLDTALNATGQFSFDHTDIPDGAIPDTSGALDLEVLGLNRLIDTFAELDILPQAQFLAFRAMIGFIATQSDTEDKLNSRIEIAPGGSITANGFRVR